MQRSRVPFIRSFVHSFSQSVFLFFLFFHQQKYVLFCFATLLQASEPEMPEHLRFVVHSFFNDFHSGFGGWAPDCGGFPERCPMVAGDGEQA